MISILNQNPVRNNVDHRNLHPIPGLDLDQDQDQDKDHDHHTNISIQYLAEEDLDIDLDQDHHHADNSIFTWQRKTVTRRAVRAG